MADHGWPSGKAELSASVPRARESDRVSVRSRARKGKGEILTCSPYFSSPRSTRGEKYRNESNWNFSNFFERMGKNESVVYPLPLNPSYGVVARLEDK